MICLDEHRGEGRWKPRLQAQRRGHSVQSIPGLSQESLSPTIQVWCPSGWVNARVLLGRRSISALEHIGACWGKAFQDCTELIMGCLREEPGKNLGNLGRNKYGKIAGISVACPVCLPNCFLTFSAERDSSSVCMHLRVHTHIHKHIFSLSDLHPA